MTGTLAAPIAVILLRKSRRPDCFSMLASPPKRALAHYSTSEERAWLSSSAALVALPKATDLER
jgi:hypothetical protein